MMNSLLTPDSRGRFVVSSSRSVRRGLTTLFGALAMSIPGIASTPTYHVSCAGDSQPDAFAPPGSGGHAALLTGIANDLVFLQPASFVERADGTAHLAGELESETDPSIRFLVDVDFSGLLLPGDPGHAPAGSPKKELAAAAYSDVGGPVDPSTWRYYLTTDGELTGLGSMAGASLKVTRVGPAFQIGVGASGKNSQNGGSGWIDVITIAQPTSGPSLPQATSGDFNLGFGEDCTLCALPANSDVFGAGTSAGHSFWLPGIGTDFVFDGPAQFIEFTDGTARLTGVVFRASQPFESFVVDVDFAGRIDGGEAAFPPAGSPKLELSSSAYLPNGGPVDPSSWHYYQTSDGTLTGQLGFAGAKYTFSRVGPAFQVGAGANGKNSRLGGSGWFLATRVSNPNNGPSLPSSLQGDMNLDFSGDCSLCVSEAVGGGTPHVLTIPTIGNDFIFTTAGEFVEEHDGTARIVGVLTRASDPNASLLADVTFSTLILPGNPAYPPAGSPKKELSSGNYVMNGGPIDPSTWRYYETTGGTLIGMGKLQGMALEVTRKGPAFQVGRGASGKNTNIGASGWITAITISSPTAGPTLPSTMDGDFNVDLDECTDAPLAVTYGDGCPGPGGLVPRLNAYGLAQPGAPMAVVVDGVALGGTVFLGVGIGRGLVPLAGPCELLAWPLITLIAVPCVASAPGEQMLTLATTVPNVGSAWSVTLQALSIHAGQALPATSNGVELRIQ